MPRTVSPNFSSGITVLALSVLRVIWHISHRPPAFTPGTTPLESTAAHIVHFLLYAGMFVMPLTGWAIISAHPARRGPGMAIWCSAIPPGAM